MDVTTEAQRQSVWDRWGNDVNAELQRIDAWFAGYGYMIPEPQAGALKEMLRDLSARISECPGRPGAETFAPPDLGRGSYIGLDRAVPVHAIGEDHAVQAAPRRRSVQDGLAERARQRRQAAGRAETAALLAATLVGLAAVGWLLFGIILKG